MYTIRELCKLSNLSRGTLLYYDSLGILKPAERSASKYRLYSEESVDCLNKICLYREAGVPLADIAELLTLPRDEDSVAIILEKTLRMLNEEARRIKEKQRAVIRMLRQNKSASEAAAPDISDAEKLHDDIMELIPLFAFNLEKYQAQTSSEDIPSYGEERIKENDT